MIYYSSTLGNPAVLNLYRPTLPSMRGTRRALKPPLPLRQLPTLDHRQRQLSRYQTTCQTFQPCRQRRAQGQVASPHLARCPRACRTLHRRCRRRRGGRQCRRQARLRLARIGQLRRDLLAVGECHRLRLGSVGVCVRPRRLRHGQRSGLLVLRIGRSRNMMG